MLVAHGNDNVNNNEDEDSHSDISWSKRIVRAMNAREKGKRIKAFLS